MDRNSFLPEKNQEFILSFKTCLQWCKLFILSSYLKIWPFAGGEEHDVLENDFVFLGVGCSHITHFLCLPVCASRHKWEPLVSAPFLPFWPSLWALHMQGTPRCVCWLLAELLQSVCCTWYCWSLSPGSAGPWKMLLLPRCG